MPRPRAAAALLLLAAALPARADLVVVQEITSQPAVTQGADKMTMYFKGDKIRLDTGSLSTTIIDAATGKAQSLMHEQKMAMSLDFGQLAAAARAASPSAPGRLTPTGKKQKINGLDTEEYLWEQGGVTSSYWICRDHPKKDAFLKHMALLEKNPAFSAGPALSGPSAAELPGIPVRFHTKTAGVESTVTLVSIEEKPLDDSLFAIPAGYQTLDLPGAP